MAISLSDGSIREYWGDLFEKKDYSDNFPKYMFSNCRYPKRSVWVPFSDIAELNDVFAECLLSDPERCLRLGNQVARSVMKKGDYFTVRVTGLPEGCMKDFAELNGSNGRVFCTVGGFVTKASAVIPASEGGDSGKDFEPESRIVEIRDSLSQCSRKIKVRLTGDLVGTRIYGEYSKGSIIGGSRIFGKYLKLNGFMRRVTVTKADGSLCQEDVFEANSFETGQIDMDDCRYDELKLTPEDIERIKEASKDPDVFDILVRSIAPTIKGMDDVRESLALQLFGGVLNKMDDGCPIYGNINILLISEDSDGIGQVLGTMSRLSPRGIFMSGGKDSDMPFGGKVRSENGLVSADVGAMTVANNGLICYEDIDHLDADDKSVLYDYHHWYGNILSDSGIDFVLPINTSILASVRPLTGSMEEKESIMEQVDISVSELANFDLIYVVNGISKHRESAKVYSEEFIKKYVAYARMSCNPEFEKSAQDSIFAYYQYLREKTDTIGYRQLESLFHLAEASARSRLSGTVEDSDASRAIVVFGNYLAKWLDAIGFSDSKTDA